MYHMYTRRDGIRSVQEDADRQQYVPRDQDEVQMMFLSMRATRDAARRGEHIAGWRLDAGRGAILRECCLLVLAIDAFVCVLPNHLVGLVRRRGGLEGIWSEGRGSRGRARQRGTAARGCRQGIC